MKTVCDVELQFEKAMMNEVKNVKRARVRAQKDMKLKLIGIMSTQKREQLSCYRTNCAEDVPGTVKTTTYTDACTLSFASTKIVDTRSMLPFALQCRFQEALLMHKAMTLIEKLPRVMPLAARVDGIYYAADEEAQLQHKIPLAESSSVFP